jgi:K+-transporting ATPase ATPase A chain
MTGSSLLQVGVYLLVLVALVKPLGLYMARVFEGERTFFTPVVAPVERLIYRLAGVDPTHETDWRHYAVAVLLVNFVGFVVVYALQRMQGSPTCSRTRRNTHRPARGFPSRRGPTSACST